MGKHVFVVGGLAFVLGAATIACSSDPDRPPATSSGGSAVGTSGGAGGSSSSGAAGDGGGSSSGSDGGTSSSGGSSGTSSGIIQTGLRGTVDGVPGTFDVGPTALRHSSGAVIEMFGKDAAGNEMRIKLTSNDGVAAPGAYNCSGELGNDYGGITYTTANAETWIALAQGECTIGLQSIDNRNGGVFQGTYSATLQKGGATKAVTNGQFRLTLD